MMSLFNPRIWLAFLLTIIISLLAGTYAGYRYEKKSQQIVVAKSAVTDSDVARKNEHVATETMVTIGANLTKQQATEKADYENQIAILKAKLAKTGNCRVSGAAVGMLYADANSHVSATAATGFGSGGTAAYADSTCRDQLELAARNYHEVCEPNAEQLKALQDAYNALRKQFNTSTE